VVVAGGDFAVGAWTVRWPDLVIPMSVVSLDTGFLFWLAFAGLSVWGVAFAGYASNNKFAMMGGARAIAQMVSYEVPLTMSLVPIVLIYGTFNLPEMVRAQESFFQWGVFLSPVSFVVFLICMFAETNRTPFDLPEAESELIVGYHTEYGSLKFGAFMMTEYVAMTVLSFLVSIFFFGGWNLPGVSFEMMASSLTLLGAHVAAIVIMVLKALSFLMLYVWVRWTLPRFRYDQLMALSWKFLVPVCLVNIVVTAVVLGWIRFH
jgi:NADH-quinone oxidoreductase subunit H